MNLWFLNPPPPLSCWCCNCSVCQISLLLCTLLLQEMNIHGYKGALQNKHLFRNFLPSAWGKGNLVPNPFPAYEMEYIYFAILLFPYSWWVNNTCQSRYLFHHISSLFHHVNSTFPKLKSQFVSLTSHFVKSPNPLCQQSLNNQILSSQKIFHIHFLSSMPRNDLPNCVTQIAHNLVSQNLMSCLNAWNFSLPSFP